MLTNIAVNRMLEVYKGLDKAQVLNESNVVVGEKNIFWGNPNNKRISVQPFFITSIGANILNKLKLKGRVANGGDVDINDLPYHASYQNVLDILNRSYPGGERRVAHKAVYGSNSFKFLLFKSTDLTGVYGIDALTPPSKFDGNWNVGESLYQFLWDAESQSLEDRFLSIKVDTRDGYKYYFSIPAKRTFGVNESSYLEYDLSEYTTGDVNTTESTNSYFENLTEGIEML